jgi:hypothetical protein
MQNGMTPFKHLNRYENSHLALLESLAPCEVFPGEAVGNITIDGYAQWLLDLGAGYLQVGLITPATKAISKAINRELSTGNPMVGVNLSHEGELAQTKPADIAALVLGVALSGSKIIGAVNTSIMTAPAGRKLYMSFDTEIVFANKSESKITFKIEYPGQPVSALNSFIVATS